MGRDVVVLLLQTRPANTSLVMMKVGVVVTKIYLCAQSRKACCARCAACISHISYELYAHIAKIHTFILLCVNSTLTSQENDKNGLVRTFYD